MLTIALILSSVSSLVSVYMMYKLAIKEKIITEPKILKPKKKVVVFKWNWTYWERFLENLKQ